jgi:two-component system sensor histidine kinase GlrK
MKVVTKTALGFGLLLLPLAAVLAYLLAQTDRLVTVNRSLAAGQFSASIHALELIRQLDSVEENARKYLVSGDADYLARFREARDLVTAAVADLDALSLTPGERGSLSSLGRSWRAFLASAPNTALERRGQPEHAELGRRLAALRGQARTLLASTSTAITLQVNNAAAIARRAARLSWIAAVAVLVLGVLIMYLTVRGINRPLKRLIEGTRAVSEGRFSVQIDSTGGDEFSALTRAFNSMVLSLGELERMKKDLLSHVSHELKTPLVAMQETNRLLLDGIPGALTPGQRRMLELNVDGGRRLSAMITKLLDLSRMQVGATYNFRDHELAEVVATAVAEFEARALERGITLLLITRSYPLRVRCDADRLIQVVENLLENAVRFSPADSAVAVEVGVREGLALPGAPSPGPAATIEVADSGPGLSDDDKRRVFEKFYQCSRQRVGAGVGLGLAICREITSAHGGAIWAEDSAGGGTCFTVAIPRERAGAGGERAPRSSLSGPARRAACEVP